MLPEALRGKALVINFWATWCEPCRKEMASLERLHRQADPAKLAVLGVSVDTDRYLAQEFLLQQRLTFANYSDAEQKLARAALGIQAFPATFVVAPDGSLRARITGVRDWGSADMLRILEQTLATRLSAR
jgi:peroxiredoxin